MSSKECILEENKVCDNCCDCNICDINPDKNCNNCAKCITDAEYIGIKIDKIDISPRTKEK